VERIRFLLADAGTYRSRGSSQYSLLIIAVAAVVLAGVAYYAWNTYRGPRDARDDASPEDLLGALCVAHELSRPERSLIAHLAQSFELPQPALLFVDPWPFDRAAETADPDAARYRELRQKLFGSGV
jgi:hypothetical protein